MTRPIDLETARIKVREIKLDEHGMPVGAESVKLGEVLDDLQQNVKPGMAKNFLLLGLTINHFTGMVTGLFSNANRSRAKIVTTELKNGQTLESLADKKTEINRYPSKS